MSKIPESSVSQLVFYHDTIFPLWSRYIHVFLISLPPEILTPQINSISLSATSVYPYIKSKTFFSCLGVTLPWRMYALAQRGHDLSMVCRQAVWMADQVFQISLSTASWRSSSTPAPEFLKRSVLPPHPASVSTLVLVSCIPR